MITKLRLIIVVLGCGVAVQIVRQYRALTKYRTLTTSTSSAQENNSPQVNNFSRHRFTTFVPTASVAVEENRPKEGSSMPTNMIVVDAAGNFSDRVKRLNDAVDDIRSSILSTQNITKDTEFTVYPSRPNIRIYNDNFISKLSNYPQVTTVVVPWKRAPTKEMELQLNLHVQTYYQWTGSHIMCNWLDKPNKIPVVYFRVFRKMYCNEDKAASMRPTMISYGHVKDNDGKRHKPEYYSSPPVYLLHFLILSGGSHIDDKGHISSGNVRLLLLYCFKNRGFLPLTRERLMEARYVDEVFAIRHPPADAYYHGMIEEMPRIAPFVEFLRRRPDILIHGTDRQRAEDFLRVLGMDPSRFITGPVRAGIVYMPRTGTCMMPRVVETQLLARHCHDYIRSNFEVGPRNRLILIQRSGERRFRSRAIVAQVVRAAAVQYGLQYTAFLDNPPPSFNLTMTLFYEAVIVVAPHGAGLSNILFSRPGTFIFEVVPNNFVTPMCYLQLAHGLGHHWYGLAVERLGSTLTRVNIDELRNLLQNYLKLMYNNGTVT